MWGHFVLFMSTPKTDYHNVSFLEYHICRHPLRPFEPDPASVKIINHHGSCCLWVILMHFPSMLGQFFVFSGILQAARKLRYLLPQKTKKSTFVLQLRRVPPGKHSVAVKQMWEFLRFCGEVSNEAFCWLGVYRKRRKTDPASTANASICPTSSNFRGG